jgi:hypothetical protein
MRIKDNAKLKIKVSVRKSRIHRHASGLFLPTVTERLRENTLT